MTLNYPDGYCSPGGAVSCFNLSDRERCSDCRHLNQPPIDYPFTSDGCSGGLMCFLRIMWRVAYKIGRVKTPEPPWEADCLIHDAAYWPGGSRADRLMADIKLATAVCGKGYPFLARLMFLGISVGGVPRLPLPWRWGYARKWPRGYLRRR